MLTINLRNPIHIKDFRGKEGNIMTLNGTTIESILTIESFLSTSTYITFKGKLRTGEYDVKDVVVKFYHTLSDNTNEFEIMKFVDEETSLKNIVPIPYINVINPLCKFYTIDNLKITHVWQIIIYEYIPGVPLIHLTDINFTTLSNDIMSILQQLYSVGLVHADLHEENIIRTNNGRFRLIDFGQSFSIDHRFPPLKAVTMYKTMLMKEKSINFFRDYDLQSLSRLIIYLRFKNPHYASKL